MQHCDLVPDSMLELLSKDGLPARQRPTRAPKATGLLNIILYLSHFFFCCCLHSLPVLLVASYPNNVTSLVVSKVSTRSSNRLREYELCDTLRYPTQSSR